MKNLKEFLRLESASGILLLIAAILAMAVENSAAKNLYDALLGTSVEIRIGEFEIAKPLLLWINDGLMAVFFFLIGLEVKREILAGELSDPSHVVLPIIAAIGGMAIPAAIYASINWDDPIAMKGWAIPSATDIAFALGVLALLGSRVPQSLKLFLMTLAIIDDLGAIIIIAVFYTADLSFSSLLIASIAIIALFTLNRRSVLGLTPYVLVGLVLWAAVLKSGVHATLAGVLTAFFIPFKKISGESLTQLEKLEHDLHPSVVFGILPLFAFANAGIPFEAMTLEFLIHPVPLGIAAGLFFGNQLGVFGFSLFAIKLGISKLPHDVSWLQLYGVASLCGIGFTMSLFVGSLAFEQGGPDFAVDDRLGILVGSLASGILGYVILRFAYKYKSQ
ncbi:MAG: Na+/H+ antiporter NhaA [Candidatus Thiodiazotropha sp. (ex Dulcina madagascariensis)]|nr:Na+/H+ antiporter NhaA [Candidatus Thiodiazotropha sp. (ex Dulcina madagascariensis)]MCU7928862.1 Na+/H+ antiporter NhaA [Candidatus Thiodiazotropha sp. (ex Dulcina madagascariensis)]